MLIVSTAAEVTLYHTLGVGLLKLVVIRSVYYYAKKQQCKIAEKFMPEKN